MKRGNDIIHLFISHIYWFAYITNTFDPNNRWRYTVCLGKNVASWVNVSSWPEAAEPDFGSGQKSPTWLPALHKTFFSFTLVCVCWSYHTAFTYNLIHNLPFAFFFLLIFIPIDRISNQSFRVLAKSQYFVRNPCKSLYMRPQESSWLQCTHSLLYIVFVYCRYGDEC